MQSFIDYVSAQIGTDKWCVTAKELSDGKRDAGYRAINPARYHKLWRESPFYIEGCHLREVLLAGRATPERPFIATGSSELSLAEKLVAAGVLLGQGDGLLDGVSQTFVGVR